MGLDMWMTRRPREEDEVAYWRKANAIHQWLVDNVQWGKMIVMNMRLPSNNC